MIVQIYWNLHKKRWSIRNKSTGRVCGYANAIRLQNCKFVVQQGGRRRVLETQQKNVHAFAEGEIVYFTDKLCEQITYNPYKYETFIFKENKLPAYGAEKVFLTVRDQKPQVFTKPDGCA